MNPYSYPHHPDTKTEDLPSIPGCSFCDVECRSGAFGGSVVFKKKCCKKYKRKGWHCKSCPKK